MYTDIFEELIDHALMLLFRQVRPSREYDVTAARALIQRNATSGQPGQQSATCGPSRASGGSSVEVARVLLKCSYTNRKMREARNNDRVTETMGVHHVKTDHIHCRRCSKRHLKYAFLSTYVMYSVGLKSKQHATQNQTKQFRGEF